MDKYISFHIPDDGYNGVRLVLNEALSQMTKGKGAERHGSDVPFEDQACMQAARAHGLGFLTGQAEKKGREAHRILRSYGAARAQDEILGAVNYLAAAYLLLGEQESEGDGTWSGE